MLLTEHGVAIAVLKTVGGDYHPPWMLQVHRASVVRSIVRPYVVCSLLVAFGVSILSACSAPAATGSMNSTFLADERPNASAWSAERIWLLVITQNASDITGSLTSVGPTIDPGSSPQETTRLLEAKQGITGTAGGTQISIRSAADATGKDYAPVELTGTLDGDRLNARIRGLNEPPSAARELVFRRVMSDDAANVEAEWTRNLNLKLGVQAEATLQARRNR
jgi:hypothetical protein